MNTTRNSRNKRSGQHKTVAIISLLACLSVVLYDAIWSFEDNDDNNLYDSDYEHLRSTRRLATEEEPKFNLSNYWQDNILWHNFVSRSATATESEHQPQHNDDVFAQPSDFAVCGRRGQPWCHGECNWHNNECLSQKVVEQFTFDVAKQVAIVENRHCRSWR